MKLTKRELVLLIILLVIAIGFGEFYLLAKPGLARYQELVDEGESLDQQINQIQLQLQIAEQNRKKIEERMNEIEMTSDAFLGQLKPSVLLYATYDLMTRNGFAPSTYSISPLALTQPTPETVIENEVSYQMSQLVDQYRSLKQPAAEPGDEAGEEAPPAGSGTIAPIELIQYALAVTGPYDQVRQLIDDIYSQEKSILVSQINFSSVEDDEVLANFNLQYFGLTKMDEDNTVYNTWPRDPFDGGTDSPFISIEATAPDGETGTDDDQDTGETEETDGETETTEETEAP